MSANAEHSGVCNNTNTFTGQIKKKKLLHCNKYNVNLHVCTMLFLCFGLDGKFSRILCLENTNRAGIINCSCYFSPGEIELISMIFHTNMS